ncbi:DNA-methyltransferase [Halorubrum lacusprofundi]|jgi:site-specific DNA-methyltransferase (adenine-specific)|uniref:DNA-methyltransferase n=1 Tax=Halorubrum lacusprofundi TaxID=2247 RepID=UPI00197AB5F1|nr:site-specific DNA-methyltransferase [Halorubrum lacusprofundi]MCG1008257.1 site-specific DNA-methyltransferase [Halorubrum lacusprofundi]
MSESQQIMGYEPFQGNSFQVLEEEFEPNSIHAVVTDPPYGVVEFQTAHVEKMREGTGGVWRIPPELDGSKRKPLPRFTTLTESDKEDLRHFFKQFGESIERVLRPGGHVFVACTQLLMHEVSKQLDEAGLERRDVLVRETKTLRGGDRPKGAHDHPEYKNVSSMPRVYWEPWLLYRKPFDGRLDDNLGEWQTGGLRRESDERPFTDLLGNGKTPKEETQIVKNAHPGNGDEQEAHPNLKPQKLMRELCHAALPLREGKILDPFMGSGSTIAAAHALGYDAVGIELDETFYEMAENAIPKLAEVPTEIEKRDDVQEHRTQSRSLSDFN